MKLEGVYPHSYLDRHHRQQSNPVDERAKRSTHRNRISSRIAVRRTTVGAVLGKACADRMPDESEDLFPRKHLRQTWRHCDAGSWDPGVSTAISGRLTDPSENRRKVHPLRRRTKRP